MSNFFFYLFCSLILASSSLVVFSKNPIYSVLYLILSFCNSSALLFSLNLELLPITFIVVYVGAIAVLFLFVIMMLNIKIVELRTHKENILAVMALILLCLFLYEVLVSFDSEVTSLAFYSFQSCLLSDLSYNNFYFTGSSLFYTHDFNITSIGITLFLDFWAQFIIVGYILLFAMIGAILLTINKSFLSKSQNVYFQVLRDFNSAIVLYH